MQLSPDQQERLPLSYAAEVARRRRGRGLDVVCAAPDRVPVPG